MIPHSLQKRDSGVLSEGVEGTILAASSYNRTGQKSHADVGGGGDRRQITTNKEGEETVGQIGNGISSTNKLSKAK